MTDEDPAHASEAVSGGDIADALSEASDPGGAISRFFPEDLRRRYELYSYRNAALTLAEARPTEFAELIAALRNLRVTRAMIAAPGGIRDRMGQVRAQLATRVCAEAAE